ncbi:MAG: hydantoinase/oxoprolinase family protein [Polyangiaceae bacterium]
MEQSYKLGIDVGGTFTDLFLWTSAGETRSFKVLSTPKDPSIGVLDGIGAVAKALGLTPAELTSRLTTIVHGTTVTTNATLTRRGAKTGLVTTVGVRDALEMRRGIREDQYDNRMANVPPLVPRYLRRSVRGRLDYAGRELEPLGLDDVKRPPHSSPRGRVSIAVYFMNAFVSPAHEQAAAEESCVASCRSTSSACRARCCRRSASTTASRPRPSTPSWVRCSATTCVRSRAAWRRRASAARSDHAVERRRRAAGRHGEEARGHPALGSGGRARAAAAWAGPSGYDDCLVVDMGGTSFDASLVRGGAVELKAEGEIARLRIALPMLDIVTIGAGGGSIGRVDAGGLLRMGPGVGRRRPRAGLHGRGGTLPTCTDANVVLGYLDPSYFAGGDLRLDADASRAAIARHVAEPLGLDVERAAVGMYRVINSNMAHGVQEITVKRGLDPREFPMVVAGGAGSLHGTAIASRLDIPVVLVPPVASGCSAPPACCSPISSTTSCAPASRSSASSRRERLQSLVGELTRQGEAQLRRADLPPRAHRAARGLDLRYLKQYHEVTVPVALESIERGDWASMIAAFHREHDRLYGYELSAEGTPVELINVRVKSVGRVEKPALPRLPAGTADPSRAAKKPRRAYVPERDRFEELQVFDGHALQAGNRISGPALIERTDTTIFVSAAYDARIDDYGTAIVERRAS